ncbi:MAG: hypothetical protein GEV03_04100 [Streptosporangiales bacterium]|nr:hypothetical protein [Streptosporangiales bacterium]
MVDEEGLQALRTSLEADGYRLEVQEEGDRVGVRISATAEACADCLVPEPVLRGILQQTLGVPEGSIDLTYPRGSEEAN